MHRIDSINAQDGRWVAGNPQTGQRPTIATAAWFNAVQEEIAHVIESSGLELDKSKNDQLTVAINTLFKRQYAALEQRIEALEANGGVSGAGTVTCQQIAQILQQYARLQNGLLTFECPNDGGTNSNANMSVNEGVLHLDIAGEPIINSGLLSIMDSNNETYAMSDSVLTTTTS